MNAGGSDRENLQQGIYCDYIVVRKMLMERFSALILSLAIFLT